MCTTFDRVVAVQILTLLLEMLLSTTTYAYTILSKVYGSVNTKDWYITPELSALGMFEILVDKHVNQNYDEHVIIIPAHVCAKRASSIKKTLRNININKHDPSVARNVKSFSLQLLHEDFKITAGGFFTIDLRLAYMVIGALTTYITIIVQFDLMYFK